MVLEVPSKSHLEISIEFEKSLLKWLEYPPDANKGFYVNSALISTVLEDKTNFTGKMVTSITYFKSKKIYVYYLNFGTYYCQLGPGSEVSTCRIQN